MVLGFINCLQLKPLKAKFCVKRVAVRSLDNNTAVVFQLFPFFSYSRPLFGRIKEPQALLIILVIPQIILLIFFSKLEKEREREREKT